MFKLCTSLFCAFLLVFFAGTSYPQEFSLDNKNQNHSSPMNLEGEVEIHYDTDNTSGVGAASTDFIIAARFTTTQTGVVVGEFIKKVRIFIWSPTLNNTATLRIYSAGTASAPGAEVYNQVFTTTSMAWHEITLTTPVMVPNADIWVGAQATALAAPDQFWGGTDAGPNHPDGQYIFFNGAWATLFALNPALTFNWNIRAVVDEIVPVELTSFTASINPLGLPVLNWVTASEINNRGFEVEKRTVEGQFVTVGFVEGYGTTTEEQSYTYVDKSVNPGTYYYRLKQVDFDGKFEYSGEVELDVTPPLTFSLDQNYPNPFNPNTNIKFSLKEAGYVKLAVYNTLGEEISVLANGQSEAGLFEVNFDASNLSSGTYIYRLETPGFVTAKKMLLMK